MKNYSALDCQNPNFELLYAALDDFSPTAIEERADGVRAFFLTRADRDAAHATLGPQFHVTPLEVPDDDWARRSQEGLQPITIGRITVVPNQQSPITGESAIRNPQSAIIVIRPSMGFGTGHHATTRLCLRALQEIHLDGKRVLDVGTGSGILAIAARTLGAARAVGIDSDPDAIQSARENLDLNPGLSDVTFTVADLGSATLEPADIVTANLTGALLARAAAILMGATAPAGVLIVSGLMTAERADVLAAFRGSRIVWEQAEDEWLGLAVKKA